MLLKKRPVDFSSQYKPSFSGCDLTKYFKNAKKLKRDTFTKMDLTKTNLTGLDFSNKNLTCANLSGATFTDVLFNECVINPNIDIGYYTSSNINNTCNSSPKSLSRHNCTHTLDEGGDFPFNNNYKCAS